MISFDEARGLLAERVRALDPVELDLSDALGCRIAVPPQSDVNAPPGDVSAMDGYAMRHSDLAACAPLPVAFEVQAGRISGPLPKGNAARIFTGAVLPEGADTVVPQEQATVKADGSVELEPLAARSHVRAKGEIMAAGEAVAEKGDLVTPHRVALLAAAGAHLVTVVPRPRVAVVVTGTEVVPVSEVPGPGQIRNSNGPMMDALARAAGLDRPLQLQAADTTAELRSALETAIAASDLVLTSGGASVGDYDLVPEVVRSLGGEVLFHRLAVKPGKPILAARCGDGWLLGLPGNPVSVLAGWRMFGLPLAAALAGDTLAFHEEPIMAALSEPVTVRGDRAELRPALVSMDADGPTVEVLPWKGSHDLVTSADANALARFEAKTSHEAGDVVPCYPL
jgi:molybdopterin molybdotransferase